MTRVVMVASEAAPFAKTGGLADVVGALPAALQELGDEVAVVMPRYRQIELQGTEMAVSKMAVQLGSRQHIIDVRTLISAGVRFYFVDAPEFFDREGIYNQGGQDYWDNHRRFALLSLAALRVVDTLFECDVLHCHDWQPALIPLYSHSWQYSCRQRVRPRTVLTIHNLGYQGRFEKKEFADLGFDENPFNFEQVEYFGGISFLKGGIAMSDWITTVSPTYAKEIQSSEGGFGLDGVLRNRSAALTGILNGVDYAEWNPEVDTHLAANYSADDLSGKRECKKALLEEFGLPTDNPDRPLIAIVSRFAEQKGFDIIAGMWRLVAEEDLQIVILGSGDQRYECIFNDWQRSLPDKVGTWIGYNNQLAHRIEAGADIFLMPSQYEPCGLNQIYSLRYGTLPLVRATGGLVDTVHRDVGFVFEEYTIEALENTLADTLVEFRDKASWVERMKRAMKLDYSWKTCAKQYSSLYRSILGGR